MIDGAGALLLGSCCLNGWGVGFYRTWARSWMVFYAADPHRAIKGGRTP